MLRKNALSQKPVWNNNYDKAQQATLKISHNKFYCRRAWNGGC